MIFSTLLLAQALSATDIRPTGFYVMGVQQGMTLAEYNALIANGGYNSRPIAPGRYWANINNKYVFVVFCKDIVTEVIANYSSSDWMISMKSLEKFGFKWGDPYVYVNNDNLRAGEMVFSVTAPKGFSYFVVPMIKAATLQNRDAPTFQLMFDAVDNSCR